MMCLTPFITIEVQAPSCLDANNGKRRHKDNITDVRKVTGDSCAYIMKAGVVQYVATQGCLIS
jgi:hypothetical protein